MIKHPAHLMDFDELQAGLAAAISAGHVYERHNGDLSLFCYTKSAVYDEAWTPFTTIARGLILDRVQRKIVATPFPKFFNIGEGGHNAPSDEFYAYEKLDGSLIIAFWHGGAWRTATKGDFFSEQAKAAQALLPFDRMVAGITYLAELTGPSNKIVVRYQKDECRLLGAYTLDGLELSQLDLEALDLGGMQLANTVKFSSLAELLEHAEGLPVDEEGYVLKFSDGTRLKVKGNEYRRLHALISRLSPLTVWEAMSFGQDESMRRELPEEFWSDFDRMRQLLRAQLDAVLKAVEEEASKWSDKSDKDIGMALKSIPDPARSFIFALRKGQMEQERIKQSLFRLIRPAGNKLEGYVPSYAMRRANEELQG